MTKKKCLLTGYPGFLGTSLYQQLHNEYEIHSLGLAGTQGENHTFVDLSKGVPAICDTKYDLVIHAAGKAHVNPQTAAERESFDLVNHVGTRNLLKALEALDGLAEAPGALILISSVAVYGRDEGERIAETASLDAVDSYGLSKIKAEEAVLSWDQQETTIGILRLPLVVGPNPPGNLGRLLHAIEKGRYFNVAGGKAKRSLVWIEDIGPFIVKLAAKGGTYNLTDGHDISFADLSQRLCKCMDRKMSPSLPKWIARTLAVGGDVAGRCTRMKMPFDSLAFRKMTSDLTFSCDDAIVDFDWEPTPVLDRLDTICGR